MAEEDQPNTIYMKIDLHNHSYYSDGVLSPTEVVRLAKEQRCDMFALTDHDTVDGLAEAKTEANKLGMQFIPGVEVSAMWSNMTIHILGLGVDADNEVLQAGLKQHLTVWQVVKRDGISQDGEATMSKFTGSNK